MLTSLTKLPPSGRSREGEATKGRDDLVGRDELMLACREDLPHVGLPESEVFGGSGGEGVPVASGSLPVPPCMTEALRFHVLTFLPVRPF